MRIHITRRVAVVALGTVAVAAAATTAVAAIPGGDGQVHACVAKANRTSYTGLLGPLATLDRVGTMRAIDADAGQSCASDETPLAFDVKGQKGDTGASGPAGATGPQGPAGPSLVSGYQIVENSQNVDTGDAAVVIASCPAGKKVLGGAASTDLTNGLPGTPVVDLPRTDGSGWVGATATANNGASTESLKVYAICANAG
jgi:hypothetical protein